MFSVSIDSTYICKISTFRRPASIERVDNLAMMETTAAVATTVRGLFKATHPIKAKWERIDAISLPRSSHTLSVVAGRAYIFGGEVNPREPVDNLMHIITLPYSSTTSADYKSIPATPEFAGGDVPEKRVGHSAAVIGERVFVYGGRGGKDMKPLKENGRVWVYDTRTDTWTFLDPTSGTPFPEERSYQSSVAIPRPAAPISKHVDINNAQELPKIGTIASRVQTDEESGGYGTFFVHAGCPASGRTNDLWGFDVRSRTWKEFPSAPGKPRGGTAIAVSKDTIYRYGGFNGTGEEGGALDLLRLGVDTFDDDKTGHTEVAVSADRWETLNFEESGMQFPGHRSVAGLQTITTGMGREYLVLMLGERDPSSDGHNGAGMFWGDVWCFQCPPQGMTAASFKDATWQALGRQTGEGHWSAIEVADAEGVEGEDVHKLVPGERGWFASSSLGELDQTSCILWGGLNGRNEREDNGWILRIE